MAIMIPEAISKFDTDGEGRVYNYLKDNLSDEYIVFYNLRSEITGLVDFIIVCPSGILGIEVKDWSAHYIESCKGNIVYLYNPSHPFEEHPVKVSKDRIWNLVRRQIEKTPALMSELGSVWFPSCYSGIAWYVNLTDIELEQKLSGGKRRNNNTIHQLTSNDFDNKNAQELINSCFQYIGMCNTRNLTNRECMAIKKFILQEKKIHVTFDDLVIELDKQQIECAKHMKYGQYILRGAGGTGKTVRLIGRAIYLAEEHSDFNILFVTSKKDLADLVSPNFQSYSNIYLYTKYEVLKKPNIILPPLKFDALLIDELQAFTEQDIKDIKSLLRVPDKSHFIGVIDGGQNTFNNQYNLLNIADEIKLLTQNYRNGDNILAYIQSIGHSSSDADYSSSSYYEYYEQTISHHTNVGEVYYINLRMFNHNDINPQIYNQILSIITTYPHLSPKEFAIINIGNNKFLNRVSEFLSKSGIETEFGFSANESIKLLNNNSVNGLEFKVVILLVDCRITSCEQSKILSCSRAREYLHVIDY